MPRPSMFSPEISQLSPRLYRLGKHFGVPMTQLADRLICFGFQHLEQVIPDKPLPVVSLKPLASSARRSNSQRSCDGSPTPIAVFGLHPTGMPIACAGVDPVSQPRDLAGETDLSGGPDYL